MYAELASAAGLVIFTCVRGESEIEIAIQDNDYEKVKLLLI